MTGKKVRPEEQIPNGKDLKKSNKAYKKFMSKRGKRHTFN